jgi:hypothetical protein
MKNAFLVSSLVLTAGYSVLAAANTFGVASISIPNLSTAIGAYAAIGVLAFAFRDYTRQPRPSLQRSLRPSTRPAVHPLSFPHSTPA